MFLPGFLEGGNSTASLPVLRFANIAKAAPIARTSKQEIVSIQNFLIVASYHLIVTEM
jgi:hypothetical protein